VLRAQVIHPLAFAGDPLLHARATRISKPVSPERILHQVTFDGLWPAMHE